MNIELTEEVISTNTAPSNTAWQHLNGLWSPHLPIWQGFLFHRTDH